MRAYTMSQEPCSMHTHAYTHTRALVLRFVFSFMFLLFSLDTHTVLHARRAWCGVSPALGKQGVLARLL